MRGESHILSSLSSAVRPSETLAELHSKLLAPICALCPLPHAGLGGTEQGNPQPGVAPALWRGETWLPTFSFAVHCQRP